jgi:TonB family protein
MRQISASLLLLVFFLALDPVPMVQAQTDEHPNRSVILSQKPDYPAILRTKGIGGIVRLRAKVLPNGNVADIQVLGGNPVLAESAVKAVMKWRFVPAASASNEIVTLDFNPH